MDLLGDYDDSDNELPSSPAAAAIVPASSSDADSSNKPQTPNKTETVQSAPPVAPLPIGWQELKDAASGRTYYVHAATSKTTYTRPGSAVGRDGAGVKRPPPLAAAMLLGASAGDVKRKTEEGGDRVEIEYFSKEDAAREAAAKAKTPVVLSRTVTGKWVDDVVTPWGAVKEDQKAPFSKIPGQAFNYAKIDDKSSMAAEREKAKKHKTFNEIEKRKRDLGQCSRAKSTVEDEKRVLRQMGGN